MIIPTADFNPMFAEDGVPFREKMLAYIQQEFGELLASQPAAAVAVRQLANQTANLEATFLLNGHRSIEQMPSNARHDRAA